MRITGRLKLVRKYGCDFWCITIFKLPKKNKFFNHFRYSLIWNVKQRVFQNELLFSKRRVNRLKNPRIASFGLDRKSKGYFDPFFGDENITYLKLLKRLEYRRFFDYRRHKHILNVFNRGFYRRNESRHDLLLGTKTAFQYFKPKRYRGILKKRFFFRQLTLFYNDFDVIKLRRFGRWARKGQSGGINKFFFLLESRLDSIVQRLNIATKFILRQVIKAKFILVDKIPISYSNFVVKEGSIVTFSKKYNFGKTVYKTIKDKVSRNLFYVQPPFYLEINYCTLKVFVVKNLIDPTYVPYPFLKSKSKILTGLHTVLWGW